VDRAEVIGQELGRIGLYQWNNEYYTTSDSVRKKD
jgi:hypothetical protein